MFCFPVCHYGSYSLVIHDIQCIAFSMKLCHQNHRLCLSLQEQESGADRKCPVIEKNKGKVTANGWSNPSGWSARAASLNWNQEDSPRDELLQDIMACPTERKSDRCADQYDGATANWIFFQRGKVRIFQYVSADRDWLVCWRLWALYDTWKQCYCYLVNSIISNMRELSSFVEMRHLLLETAASTWLHGLRSVWMSGPLSLLKWDLVSTQTEGEKWERPCGIIPPSFHPSIRPVLIPNCLLHASLNPPVPATPKQQRPQRKEVKESQDLPLSLITTLSNCVIWDAAPPSM